MHYITLQYITLQNVTLHSDLGPGPALGGGTPRRWDPARPWSGEGWGGAAGPAFGNGTLRRCVDQGARRVDASP